MKGMSPLHTYSRYSPRKPAAQDGNENAHELGGVLSNAVAPNRAPLAPIPLPGQVSETSENFALTPKSKSEMSTPRAKGRQSQRAESFDSSTHTTPEKNTLLPSNGVIGRNRFGWHQHRHPAGYGMEREGAAAFRSISPTGRNAQEYGTDDVIDLQTPPKPWKNFSGPEVSHGNACTQSTNSNRTGHSNHSTPRSSKSVRPPLHDSEATGNSCGSQAGTPNRVSRSLKYSHQTANCGSSVSSALANNRSGPPGVRPTGLLLQSSRPLHFADYQAVEVPHFELEVDPSFWDDHNVQVLIRTRPPNASEISSNGYSRCLRQESPHTVTWIGHPECRFTFDHVACETITQEKLFKTAGVPMVDNCMLGYNSCMFAYGQTGSGKTHTMLGDIGDLEQRPSDNRGMTPRIFEYLFAQISMEEESRRDENLKFICKCSFLEIYNEQITDLLEPSSTNLQMREDMKKGVYVENLREVEVRSVQDVVFLLLQGAANRRVAATNMNKESSRSHSVFTCVIESKWETDSMSNIRFGRLNLVDLAGSERQKSSGAEGERLKEAANINKSLSTLGLVIMILVDVAHGKQRHVPYRDSKLTFLLQDSLGGNSKTTIIANVSPSVCSAAETLSTLKFAQRAKFIQNNAIVNEDASGDVLALRLQIQQLKEELNRLRRQSISRIPLPIVTAVPEVSTLEIPDFSKGLRCASHESFEVEKDNGTACKKIKTLEAVLAGSLRRERDSDNAAKQLHEEIEQLNRLVRQREDDAQCSKMMLRFREDKIRRLESTLDGGMSAEVYRTEENQALKEEVQLLRGRIDRNPELTRFAMENIRLMDQLRRFQDFYGGGERETLLAEISSLRDQLSNCMDAGVATEELAPQTSTQILEQQDLDDGMAKNIDSEEKGIISQLKCQLKEEEEMLQMQMSRCDELNFQLLEAVRVSETLQKELQESKEANRELVERLHLTEASLATAQEAAASAQATVKQIRVETEEIAHQQRQSFSEIQEATAMWRLQELQLRSQLEEAQQMIQELSSQIASESVKAVTENPANRQNEDAERTLELQMEVDTLSHLLEEERMHRRDAEERSLTLSTQLDELEERELDVSKRLLESVENSQSQKSLVDSLEVQQSFLLGKIKELEDDNIRLGEILNKKEREAQVLTGYVVYLQSELQRELELRVLEAENNEGQNSNLKVKLERTRKALRKAQHLNNKLQSEQDTLKACEHEKDLVRADAEMETTEAIALLQSEIQNLCEDQEITKQREVKAEHTAMQLATDLRNLQVKYDEIIEENMRLSKLYEDVVKQKDSEISNLRQDWNLAATSLIECLAEGNQALDDAAQEIENIAEDCTSPSRAKPVLEEGTYNKKEGLVEVLQGRLLHAQKLAKQTENKVRVLSDATLAIAQFQRQEKATMQADLESLTLVVEEKCSHINQLLREVKHWKLRVLEVEKMAFAAFLVINKFSSQCDRHVDATDLSRTEDRLVMLVEIQLLQDLLSLQGKLAEDELSRSSSLLENKIQEHATELKKKKGCFETTMADLQKQVTELGEKFLLEAKAVELLQRKLGILQTKLSSTESDLETVSAEFQRHKNEWDSEKSNLIIDNEWLDSRLAEKDKENLYLDASVKILITLVDSLQEMDARMIDKSSILSQQMLVGLQIENSYMNEEITEIEKHLQNQFFIEKRLELALCSLQETCAKQHAKLEELQHLAEELDVSQKTISQLETDKLNMMDAIMNEKAIVCHLSHQIEEQDADAAIMRLRHTEVQLECLRLGEKVDDLSNKLAKLQINKDELEDALQKERLLAVQLQKEVELTCKQVESLVSERERLELDLTSKSLLLQEESQQAQILCVKMNNMESNSRALLHELDKQKDYVRQIQLQHEEEFTQLFSCINAATEQLSNDVFLVLVDTELRRNSSAHEVCSLKSEVVSLREQVNREGEDVVKTVELEKTVSELETSMQQLEGELQLTCGNLKASHMDMELSERKCAGLLADLESARKECAQQKFMGIVDIEIEKAVLNSQIQHLENTLLSNESTLDIFKDKLYQLSNERASLKMENIAQENLILQLQKNLDSCSRELECCQMEVKDAEQRSVVALTKLRDVTNEMERENLTVLANMESLKNEVDGLRVQNSAQQEVIEQLKQESLQGETHFRGMECRAKQAEERCVYLSKTLEDVTETSKAETYVNVFESEILKGVLSNQVLVIEKDLFLVNQRSQEMKEQILEYNKLIGRLKSDNGNLSSQVEALLLANQKDREVLQVLSRDLGLCREKIAHLNMENKDLIEGLYEQAILTEQLRDELHHNCTEISKIRSSHHQEVEKFLKIITSFRDDVRDSCEKMGQLDMEREDMLACQGIFFKKVMMELEACENEMKEMESNQRLVNGQLQENTELLWNAKRELKKASLTVSELKVEQYLSLEMIEKQQRHISLLFAGSREYLEKLMVIEHIHASCSDEIAEREVNLQNALLKLADKEEELRTKESALYLLQSELVCVSQREKTLDEKVRNLEDQLERLFEEQEKRLNMVSILQQEKEALQKELQMKIDFARNESEQKTIESFFTQEIFASQFWQVAAKVEKLERENVELMAEVDQKQEDMEVLKHELVRSCGFVAEVKRAHSKTLQELHDKEKELSCLYSKVDIQESLIEHERAQLGWTHQVLHVLHEDALLLAEELQGNCKNLLSTVESHESKLLDLHNRVLAFLPAKEEPKEFFFTADACDLLFSEIESITESFCMMYEDHERAAISFKHMKLELEEKQMQVLLLSTRITELEKELQCIQKEKRRCELTAQKHEVLKARDALQATHEGSQKLIQAVQGHEMKLAGLQMKIETITEQMTQEIGQDTKIAFMEGCELVLSEVEKEVRSCREHADLAWKKFEEVLEEKRKAESELQRKDQVLKKLQMEVNLSQEFYSHVEPGESGFNMEQDHADLRDYQLQITSLKNRNSELQNTVDKVNEELVTVGTTASELRQRVLLLQGENEELKGQVKELDEQKESIEDELEDKRLAVEALEAELLELNTLVEHNLANSLGSSDENLDVVIKERDELHAELVVLNEQLEMAQQLAEEHEAVAVEARQVAETSKTYAEQKEEEAKLLERSVQELESTVNALETQVGMVKNDADRQRLMRENMEIELQVLRHQMLQMQALKSEEEVQYSVWEQKQREHEIKETQAEQRIQMLENQLTEKEEQIKNCKSHTVELVAAAERQASEYHQQLRAMESIIEQVKGEHKPTMNIQTCKISEKGVVKSKGTGSPFKCIGSGLTHQINLELDEELAIKTQKIEELEAFAVSRQKEIFMLNARLAEAESMTHDVVRELLGVKLDITNYASLANHQQVQKIAERAQLRTAEAEEKARELEELKEQLHEFIEERESWLEEINRRQAEMMTARVAAEKLRQRDQILSTENEVLKAENVSQKRRLLELEEEVNKLSGQQNLQQRIHHHAKIKEENNCLRVKNEDLAAKLRRTEVLLNRVSDELGRYRAADGKTPHIDFEEEQKLKLRLQEVEEEKIQVGQKLLTLCTSILKVAGIVRPAREVDHVVAADALKYLQDRLESTEQELSDVKLKNKIDWEKHRLSELRSVHSPKCGTTVVSTQKSCSPSCASR